MSKSKVISATVNVAGPNNSITPEGRPHRWQQGTPYRSTDPVWYGCRVTVTVEGGRSYVVNIGTDGDTFRTSIFGQRESALAHVRAAAVQAYRDTFEPKPEPVQVDAAEQLDADAQAAALERIDSVPLASLGLVSDGDGPEQLETAEPVQVEPEQLDFDAAKTAVLSYAPHERADFSECLKAAPDHVRAAYYAAHDAAMCKAVAAGKFGDNGPNPEQLEPVRVSWRWAAYGREYRLPDGRTVETPDFRPSADHARALRKLESMMPGRSFTFEQVPEARS